jgi:hypothetical protein
MLPEELSGAILALAHLIINITSLIICASQRRFVSEVIRVMKMKERAL